MKIETKYAPRIQMLIGYFVLVGIGLLLTIGRWYGVGDSSFVIIPKEITSHITNFSLSMIIYLVIGYIWLLFGVKFKAIAVLGLAIIIANFGCEIFSTYLNVPDIVDAVYGVFGVLIAFVFLYFSSKYGLREKSIAN